MDSNYQYQFYPTLLDQFVRWHGSGDYKERQVATKELLDYINRVPRDMPEHVYKGRALEDLLNLEVLPDPSGSQLVYDGHSFDREVVQDMRSRLKGSVKQHFTEAVLPTALGGVRLYGYIDNIKMEKAYDTKFIVSGYELGKYLHSVQRLMYPYCLNREGVGISEFEFLITDGARVYSELYTYNPERDIPRLRQVCEAMIDFVETHRSEITDEKIFAFRQTA